LLEAVEVLEYTLEEAVVQEDIEPILGSQEAVLGSLLLSAFNYKLIT
jgi:hypothetical protein